MNINRCNSLRGGTLGNQGILISSSAPGPLRTSFQCLSVTSFNVSSRLNLYQPWWDLLSITDLNHSRWIHHELAMGSKFKRARWCILYFAG